MNRRTVIAFLIGAAVVYLYLTKMQGGGGGGGKRRGAPGRARAGSGAPNL